MTYHNLRLEELGYVEGDGEGDDGDDVLEQPPPQSPRAVQGLVVVCSREGRKEERKRVGCVREMCTLTSPNRSQTFFFGNVSKTG